MSTDTSVPRKRRIVPVRLTVILMPGGVLRTTIAAAFIDYGSRLEIASKPHVWPERTQPARVCADLTTMIQGAPRLPVVPVVDVTGIGREHRREYRGHLSRMAWGSGGGYWEACVHTVISREVSTVVPRMDLCEALSSDMAQGLVGLHLAAPEIGPEIAELSVTPPQPDRDDPWRETDTAEKALLVSWAVWLRRHALLSPRRESLPDEPMSGFHTGVARECGLTADELRTVLGELVDPPDDKGGAVQLHRWAQALQDHARQARDRRYETAAEIYTRKGREIGQRVFLDSQNRRITDVHERTPHERRAELGDIVQLARQLNRGPIYRR
jgi:hypothetical protein